MDAKQRETVVDSRIKKVLSLRVDNISMLESLDAISDLLGKDGNTIETRRSLRQELEMQNIHIAKKFLVEFDEVRLRLDNVAARIKTVHTCCEDMASRVSVADANMNAFMAKASELEEKRNFYITQSKDIKSFLDRFRLSADEIRELYHTNLRDTKAKSFFSILQRLRSAYDDCKTIVENHQYSAGFELLDVLGQHQEVAYQRLFDWVKAKCDEGSLDHDDMTLQLAIKYLQQVPSYYYQCQELLITTRRSQLVQAFVYVITQHEQLTSVRYISNMLSWIHQTVASEREFLVSLFGSDISTYSPKENEKENGVADDDMRGMTVMEMLIRCIHGLGRPLRVRVIQTIENRCQLEDLYSCCDVLFFYEVTFARILPMENAVLSTIKACSHECRLIFQKSLAKQSEQILQSSAYPLDLAASVSTRQCVKQISDILHVHNNALSSFSVDAAIEECFIDNVLGAVITPLLQSCRVCGNTLQGSDMALFMLNNVALLEGVLKSAANISSQGREATATWLASLATEASTWIEVLVREDVKRVLKRSDMDKIVELLEVLPADLVASEQPGLSQDRLEIVLRAFYASLLSTISSQYERLQDPGTREVVRALTAEKVAECYEQVYNVVSQEKNLYNAKMLMHSVSEVKVLLGVKSGNSFVSS